MYRRIFQNIAILLCVLFAGMASGQDNRTLDVKVTDILAQMPTKDLIHRDRLIVELIGLGPDGFQKLHQRLTPPGKGDDTEVRFAINSLARYASEFGREQERSFLEDNLLKAIDSQSDPQIKTFLLNQLNLVGSDNSVDSINKYLADDKLVEPTTQTLLSIKSPEATKSLLKALPSAGEKGRLTIIKALGELKDKNAVNTISKYADTEDPSLKKVTLSALANIGNPESYNLLLKAAKNTGFFYESANAGDAFLIYTKRLGEEGETDLCRKALKAIIKENKSDDKLLHNYSSALSTYSDLFGYEALPLMLDAVENENKAFRFSVLNVAENTGGVAATREWIKKAESVSPEIKAEIIYMLGKRKDPLATGLVIKSMESPSPLVRAEAITALAALKGKESVPLLINHLSSGKDVAATKRELLQLLDSDHLTPVAANMRNSSGEIKAAFIDIIAAKAGNKYFNEILKLTDSNNPKERESAFMALKNISDGENLEDLIKLLLSTDKHDETDQVQAAVIVAAKDVETEKTKKGKLLSALKETSKKERIIEILPEIGGDIALEAVSEYFTNSSGSLKESAFQALINWKDYSAAQILFNICKTNKGKYGEQAFSNFVRQVGSANIPDDQKLLQYRKIMPYAGNAEAKKMIIGSVGRLKTYLSLICLEQFLQEPAVRQTTARAIMKIALPDNNGENGFYGDKVKELLKKIATVISGEESEYDIININNFIDEMPGGTGFVSMFNGRDLDGWQGLVGNPISRSKMTAEELAEKQKEANIKMLENWSIKNNSIVFNGKGGNLCSIKEYGDFELIVDWRITKEGDSGIYLRGTPQVQIWDTSRVNVGAQVGSGGLYNNQKHESKPLKVADNPVGEWNTFHITMIGENVTVLLNGELVVDNVPLENYWDRSLPIFDKGPLELQAHGTNLAFRDIYIREINTSEIGLSDEEIEEGFVSLFNGKNLNGWQGNKTDYLAENGELLVRPERGGHGNLYTEKDYGDFIFRFEFQLTPGANNGLGIRAPLEGDAAYAGMELQILDNTAPVYANLREYQYHGSVYGVIPAKRGFLNTVGEWNEQEVVVKGTHVKVILNGTTIVDGDIAETSRNGTRDGRNHPGLKRKRGYIGFLGHGSELKFRNIRIKDLSK